VFNDLVTSRRAWGFALESLGDFKRIKSAFGTTINDVFLSVCAAALRRWLLDRGELPDENLIACIPVSTRSEDERRAWGNKVSAMFADLPTTVSDPVARLRAVHETMRVAKEQYDALGADFLADVTTISQPALLARAQRVMDGMREMTKQQPRMWNLTISNIPGARQPLYLAGCRMERTYPCVGVGDMEALNITVLSYLDSVTFGIVVCPDVVPKDTPWDLLAHIHDDLVELTAASEQAAKERVQAETG
jgi:WS/DGAT/MGAT family acyltransferase